MTMKSDNDELKAFQLPAPGSFYLSQLESAPKAPRKRPFPARALSHRTATRPPTHTPERGGRLPRLPRPAARPGTVVATHCGPPGSAEPDRRRPQPPPDGDTTRAPLLRARDATLTRAGDRQTRGEPASPDAPSGRPPRDRSTLTLQGFPRVPVPEIPPAPPSRAPRRPLPRDPPRTPPRNSPAPPFPEIPRAPCPEIYPGPVLEIPRTPFPELSRTPFPELPRRPSSELPPHPCPENPPRPLPRDSPTPPSPSSPRAPCPEIPPPPRPCPELRGAQFPELPRAPSSRSPGAPAPSSPRAPGPSPPGSRAAAASTPAPTRTLPGGPWGGGGSQARVPGPRWSRGWAAPPPSAPRARRPPGAPRPSAVPGTGRPAPRAPLPAARPPRRAPARPYRSSGAASAATGARGSGPAAAGGRGSRTRSAPRRAGGAASPRARPAWARDVRTPRCAPAAAPARPSPGCHPARGHAPVHQPRGARPPLARPPPPRPSPGTGSPWRRARGSHDDRGRGPAPRAPPTRPAPGSGRPGCPLDSPTAATLQTPPTGPAGRLSSPLGAPGERRALAPRPLSGRPAPLAGETIQSPQPPGRGCGGAGGGESWFLSLRTRVTPALRAPSDVEVPRGAVEPGAWERAVGVRGPGEWPPCAPRGGSPVRDCGVRAARPGSPATASPRAVRALRAFPRAYPQGAGHGPTPEPGRQGCPVPTAARRRAPSQQRRAKDRGTGVGDTPDAYLASPPLGAPPPLQCQPASVPLLRWGGESSFVRGNGLLLLFGPA
ncbi:basic proline-rich protein-like [Sorex araneus]|uniref:basic proline-rich protein-like n=1 Tax=Sorex araneus TaxID=42254 RepID=UPI002433E314|nr:basic proline-rich protein-like [Sorex araneus]